MRGALEKKEWGARPRSNRQHRTDALLLLGLLFGALWHFGTAVGRYHKSGDPTQVHYIDEQTGNRLDQPEMTEREVLP